MTERLVQASKRWLRRWLWNEGALWRMEAKRQARPDRFRLPSAGTARFSPAQKHGLLLLKANTLTEEPSGWFPAVNEYLQTKALDSIASQSEAGPLFFRLGGGPTPGTEGGDVVSIFMSVYNMAWSLDFAVRSLVNQTWRDWELWIIDDRSTDDSLTIARRWAGLDPRIRVLASPVNVGPYVLRNWALSRATGRWVTCHDADDWAHPRRLEHQVRYQNSRPGLFGHWAQWVRVSRDGVFRANKDADRSQDGFLRGAAVTGFFERQTLIERLGGWDPVRYAGDVEMLSRIRRVPDLSIKVNPGLTVFGLDHPGSLSADTRANGDARSNSVENRLAYRRTFESWHRSPGFQPKLSMDEPNRAFPVPAAMAVAPDLIRQVREDRHEP